MSYEAPKIERREQVQGQLGARRGPHPGGGGSGGGTGGGRISRH